MHLQPVPITPSRYRDALSSAIEGAQRRIEATVGALGAEATQSVSEGIRMLSLSKAYVKGGISDADSEGQTKAFLYAVRNCTLEGVRASLAHHLENVVGFPDPTHIADYAKEYDAQIRYGLRILEALERHGEWNQEEEPPPIKPEQMEELKRLAEDISAKWVASTVKKVLT